MAEDKRNDAFVFIGLASLILLALFARRKVTESVSSRVVVEETELVDAIERDVGPALLLNGKPSCPQGTFIRDTGQPETGTFTSTRWRCIERLIAI